MSRRRRLPRREVAACVPSLLHYLDAIVEPTIDDFRTHPRSLRHAYLACVVAYHAIDRLPGKDNRRRDWTSRSLAFAVIDMVCHRLKHVLSDADRNPPDTGIPLAQAISYGALNTFALNTTAPNEGGTDLRHLHFLLEEAIRFIRAEADRCSIVAPKGGSDA